MAKIRNIVLIYYNCITYGVSYEYTGRCNLVDNLNSFTQIFIKEFGEVVADKRKTKKLTQMHLGYMTEYSNRYISRVEYGNTNFSIDFFITTSLALGHDPVQLFQEIIDKINADEDSPERYERLVNLGKIEMEQRKAKYFAQSMHNKNKK